MLFVKVLDKNGNEKFKETGKTVEAHYDAKYEEGDRIIIELSGTDKMAVQLDETMKESIVRIEGGKYEFPIPFGDKAATYHPDAWNKDKNVIRAREVSDDEFKAYRNVALNTASVRFCKTCFPYAEANFVTRDEPWFEERNSIDGVTENSSHGAYPYQSYAGGAREDLDYTLYFGGEVEFDKIVIYLRADFADDHDTYWKSITAELSDGTKLPLSFIKTGEGQEFTFGRSFKTDKIHLTDFKQAAFPLSWAALTQIEVYGRHTK